MTTTLENPGPLQIDVGLLDEFEVAPHLTVPYFDLNFAPYVHKRLDVGGLEYVWDRSFPVKGGSAVMPDYISGLLEQGKQLLLGERGERYYVYLA